MKKTKTKAQKSESKAKITVTVLMCLVAVCLCTVIGLGAFTDVFSGEREVKAVTLVLSQAQSDELEKRLSIAAPLTQVGFKSEGSNASELLEYILPGSDKGLYACYGYEKAQKQTQADPAMRFQDEQGNYSYYKIGVGEIDSILECFDIITDHTVNTKDIYCFDGYYYFKDSDKADVSGSLKGSITSSKRIQDGRYYVTCDFDGKEAYVVASKSDEDDSPWKICEISSTALFDQLGIMIKSEKESAYDFESETQIIEGKTNDGVIYCKYTLTYPVFYGKSAGEAEANRFYQSVLSYYEQLSGDSDKLYKSYIKSGGDVNKLPLEVNYSAKVTYVKGNYIGVTNEISESLINISSINSDDDDFEGIIPANKTIEAFVFDAQTGDYVTKDNILGKDYQLIESLLYRLYNGYDYADLFSDSAVNSADIPDDADHLGEKIYLSAGTFCDKGYMFCYVCDEGYRQDVVIDFDIKDIFEITVD